MCISDSTGIVCAEAKYPDKKSNVNKMVGLNLIVIIVLIFSCLLYTSDAADERSSVDLGGRRIIKKKNYVVFRQYHCVRERNNRHHTRV